MTETAQIFLDNFMSDNFSPLFLSRYELVACLAQKEGCETFLVQSTKTGEKLVAKVFDLNAISPKEGDILKPLSHPGIPRLVDDISDQGRRYIVRQYIEGETLDNIRSREPFTKERTLFVMEKLCDIVTYLHGQNPPVLHRDIKHSNVLMDNDGQIWLIDFDIARYYSPFRTDADTAVACTRQFAAPEQFGYRQTDARSEVYSMGVLMLYLLSGTTDVENIALWVNDPILEKIIKKCTHFSPDKRYRSVRALSRALKSAPRAKVRRHMAIAIYALLFLFCGVLLGAHLAFPRIAPIKLLFGGRVRFESPLIEKAIRQSLDRVSGEPLFIEDLEPLTGLYLAGTRIGTDLGDYHQNSYTNPEFQPEYGLLTSLNDLKYCMNLTYLCISAQPLLTDISAIANMPKLVFLELCDNAALTDISAISGHEMLQTLKLCDTAITSIEPLRNLNLEDLHIGYNDIADLSPLEGMNTLRTLGIHCLWHADTAVLKTLPNLQTVLGP